MLNGWEAIKSFEIATSLIIDFEKNYFSKKGTKMSFNGKYFIEIIRNNKNRKYKNYGINGKIKSFKSA